MAATFDEARFRSFVERYVCARADKFGVDEMEMADAHACVARARAIYFHIENVADIEGQRFVKTQIVETTRRLAYQLVQQVAEEGYHRYGNPYRHGNNPYSDQ